MPSVLQAASSKELEQRKSARRKQRPPELELFVLRRGFHPRNHSLSLVKRSSHFLNFTRPRVVVCRRLVGWDYDKYDRELLSLNMRPAGPKILSDRQ